jgi:hypothetical protein
MKRILSEAHLVELFAARLSERALLLIARAGEAHEHDGNRQRDRPTPKFSPGTTADAKRVCSDAKVNRTGRPSRAASRITVSQNDSRSATKVGVPNGKTEATASTMRVVMKDGDTCERGKLTRVGQLAGCGGP